MKKLLLLSVLLFSIHSNGQFQIGEDILGDPQDHLGWSVSMADEVTVAAGCPSSNHVEIYRFDGINWIQKGNDIIGVNSNEQSGKSLSMPDSNTVAIGSEYGSPIQAGCVRVYRWNGTAWVQKGVTINGVANMDRFGYSCHMSDSNTICIGGFLNDAGGTSAGHLRVYTWDGSSWNQKGSDINGLTGDKLGWHVEMADSNNFAVLSDAGTTRVKIYSWNGNSWVQKGNAVDATEVINGQNIAFPDSNTIAFSRTSNFVKVFSWDGNSWLQKGSVISDTTIGFGLTLFMPDSSNIAVGVNGGAVNGEEHVVKTYKWKNNDWTENCLQIYGAHDYDFNGYALSMPSPNIIAIGSPEFDTIPNPLVASGKMRIFKLRGVNGSIYNDQNNNCIQEFTETGIGEIQIHIEPSNLITQTNNNGVWGIDSLVPGNYTAVVDTTSINWGASCNSTLTFIVNSLDECITAGNIGLFNTNPCTEPDVSIFAPSLRRCFSNRIVYVSACNQAEGIGTIDSSYLDVELDLLLTVDGASLPYTDLGNNIFRFETGDIYPGQCVNFTLSTTVSCNAQNGQTLCMDATLHPAESCVFDSIPSDPITSDGVGGTLNGFPQPCTLPWDQSSLSVDGWCQGDSVYFSITNTGDPVGGDMECYSPMWVTIDGVVTYTDSIMINGSETVVFSYFGNGQTWILNAEQHPLHPGNSHPNAHVELCGDSTNWTPGIINQFPLDDADPTVDIYCGQVTAPFDPNDKTGYPLGQTEEFYIQPNQQLQYVIRFQNVGTDTAFTVIVRDTLDIDLNIFTVTPGVSSHPYTFKMYGPRVLEWTFEDIQLPDSTTNSEGSNGFLTFHVDQVPDLAPGTVINNDADIYFDFELPITTNTTVHKIFEGFVEILNVEDLIIEGKQLFIYPNPTSNFITIKSDQLMNCMFNIFDQQGRKVMNGKLRGKNTEVSIGKLPQGIYTIQVVGNYKPAIIIKQ